MPCVSLAFPLSLRDAAKGVDLAMWWLKSWAAGLAAVVQDQQLSRKGGVHERCCSQIEIFLEFLRSIAQLLLDHIAAAA
jgi:hypothetical protein